MTAMGNGPLAILQRIRSMPTQVQAPPEERCEMCSEVVPAEHRHVVNVDARSLMCTCRGCWFLFTSGGAGGGKFRAVPDRYVSLGGLTIGPGGWDELQIPVSVAFFFVNSALGSVAAFYPGPAGATESLLPLDSWDRIIADNEIVRTMEPDVEALLVRRDSEHSDAFVVPIDACYELVGNLRRLWRGFDGGTEAHESMDAFFGRLNERAR
jgi:Family of unknown function (DUF5947)